MKAPKKQPVQIQTYQFSSLPSLGDKMLIFTRSHVYYLWEKLFWISVVATVFMIITSIAFIFIYYSPLLFFLTFIGTIAFVLTLVVNEYLSWYFQFYLVTKRKIVEVCNVPFRKYFINEILLDRVKCTEVDIMSNGIINQLFRIGDVVVTFDRPTHHRDSFIFSNVSNANSIREILTDYFSENRKETTTWYIQDRQNKGWVYPLEEMGIPKLHA